MPSPPRVARVGFDGEPVWRGWRINPDRARLCGEGPSPRLSPGPPADAVSQTPRRGTKRDRSNVRTRVLEAAIARQPQPRLGGPWPGAGKGDEPHLPSY